MVLFGGSHMVIPSSKKGLGNTMLNWCKRIQSMAYVLIQKETNKIDLGKCLTSPDQTVFFQQCTLARIRN